MFGDEPSIADLSLAGEILNLEGIKYPLQEKFPSIHKWLYTDMMSIEGYKKVHQKGIESVKELAQMLKKVSQSKAKPKL